MICLQKLQDKLSACAQKVSQLLVQIGKCVF